MNEIITPPNVTFALGILGLIFGVYHYFRTPQIDSEKKDALLAQQVQWTIEGNERRFIEIQQSVKDAFALASNHTHTVETKVDSLTGAVTALNVQIARLETIIEERIPKK